MTDAAKELERVDSELRYFREAIDEVRQTLTRVVTLLEGTEKLRDKVADLEKDNATLKERVTQSEAKVAALSTEWSSLKTKVLAAVVGGGLLAGGVGAGTMQRILGTEPAPQTQQQQP